MKFTQLTEVIKYPPAIRAKLSTLHSDIITFAVQNFRNTNRFKSDVITAINTISTMVLHGDTIPDTWNPKDPLVGLPSVEISNSTLGDLFISSRNITWDVTEVAAQATAVVPQPAKVDIVAKSTTHSGGLGKVETPKESLYIRPPVVPQFDCHSPWMRTSSGCIYKSIPIPPMTQSDISITTDINGITDRHLLDLFPNHIVRTRAACMYETCESMTLDPNIGLLLRIDGFTEDQIRSNIIQYPHFFKLQRVVDGKPTSFYSSIEIDGVLHNTLDVWDSLPDSRMIPKTSEFIKEYVVRRYLLERDVLKIEHKYPMYGTLLPFLTLFMPIGIYADYGYSDAVDLARQCVSARVSYKQSRNPILRGVAGNHWQSCIFNQHCTEYTCDKSCPSFVETTYLLDRNKIPITSPVFLSPQKDIQYVDRILSNKDRMLVTIVNDNTISMANLVSYIAICKNWHGNRLHCNVYHLRFSSYIDNLQKSWGYREIPESLEYEQIWMESAKILVISNIDFIQFKDFPAQTLLNIIHNRMANQLQTIVVSPKTSSLVGSGAFFSKLQNLLGGTVVK